VRNGFLPLQIDHATHLTQGTKELVSPKLSSHSLNDFQIKVQVQNDCVIPPSDQVDIHSITRKASKKCEFMPKNPLKEVLIRLRDESLNVVGHSQPSIPVVNDKFKGQGKKLGKMSMILFLEIKEVDESCQA